MAAPYNARPHGGRPNQTTLATIRALHKNQLAAKGSGQTAVRGGTVPTGPSSPAPPPPSPTDVNLDVVPPLILAGTNLSLPEADATDAGWIQMDGDLGGTGASPVVTGIQTVPVSSTPPTTGQVLEFNGTDWVPATISTGLPSLRGQIKTGTYNVLSTDCMIVFDTTGSSGTAQLPAVASWTGAFLFITKMGSPNTMTVTPNGTENINGLNNSISTISSGETFYLTPLSDNSGWMASMMASA